MAALVVVAVDMFELSVVTVFLVLLLEVELIMVLCVLGLEISRVVDGWDCELASVCLVRKAAVRFLSFKILLLLVNISHFLSFQVSTLLISLIIIASKSSSVSTGVFKFSLVISMSIFPFSLRTKAFIILVCWRLSTM